MTVNQFVNQNHLKPADAIVLRKKFMGMVDHFAIYLGKDQNGRPKFIANFTKGVTIIPEEEINQQLTKYIPTRIDRFTGNHQERQSAIERAWSKLGQKAYSFLGYNCEHFKNWVQLGKFVSEQVNKAGNVSLVVGTTMVIGGALASKGKTTTFGVALFGLGLILKSLSKR